MVILSEFPYKGSEAFLNINQVNYSKKTEQQLLGANIHHCICFYLI